MHRSTCSLTAMNEGLSARVSTATQRVASLSSLTAWQKAKNAWPGCAPSWTMTPGRAVSTSQKAKGMCSAQGELCFR